MHSSLSQSSTLQSNILLPFTPLAHVLLTYELTTGNDTDVTPTPAELHPAISFTPGFRGSVLQGDVHACTPSSIWSGPKDVSLVTAMCDRDYIADEAQMHRKLRCDTG